MKYLSHLASYQNKARKYCLLSQNEDVAPSFEWDNVLSNGFLYR